ncbi:MAG TPA: helix-turn-helix domain-containing protein [Candidatus Saccharimonadales bacterium]|nr:helix-turn-helix domain-containing protein [Candidatus Saccharimonadales bacterium]
MKSVKTPICSSNEGMCVATASSIVSSKWTPMLLFALSNGRTRFGELQEAVGGVNPRTLSARLDSLEQDGIITKSVYAEVPPHVAYTLTQKGQDLLPIIESMIVWGQKYSA